MERQDVEAKYKWHTEDIFSSDEAWEGAYSEAETSIDFKRFEGTLGTAEGVRAFFTAQEDAGKRLEKLYLPIIDGIAKIEIDTAKLVKEPSVFFEIVRSAD